MFRKWFCLLIFSSWMALASLLSACGAQTSPPCPTCGVVESVSARRVDGQATGAGAIAGAVIGGVIGSQIGGGSGKDVATAAGAIGGSYAGHAAEKRHNARTVYDVRVRMPDGQTVTVTVNAPGLVPGDRVRIVGRDLHRGWEA